MHVVEQIRVAGGQILSQRLALFAGADGTVMWALSWSRLQGQMARENLGLPVHESVVVATGISRKQLERLVRQWRDTGEVRDRRADG